MSRIVLVRHGESFGNLTGDYSTDNHDNLTDKGWAQARSLAAFWPEAFDHVVASSLSRTRQTARPTLERFGVKALLWPDLAECCWQFPRTLPPNSPELPLDPLPLEPEEEPWFAHASPGVPAENENYQDGLRRMRRAVAALDALARPGRSVLAFSHGYAISKLVILLSGEGHEDDLFDVYNTGVTTLTPLPNGRWRVEGFNLLPHRDAVLDRS